MSLRTKNTLTDKNLSTDPKIAESVSKRYAVGYSKHIRKLIDSDPHGPVAAQYVPQLKELQILPEENPDPIGDSAHSPVKGIVHRYPDRVLFTPVNVCAVYCRYCFRRENIGPKAGILKPEQREMAYEYIRTHPDIWEVILTGGDPLVLSARNLAEILTELNTIDHVKVIRIHSRVPVADPVRMSPSMIETLSCSAKPIYLVLHINHKNEITDEVKATLHALHKAGVNLLSQSVLLKNVNDNADTLASLFRELVALNVKPYYLHHPDLAPGTAHFRLSIAEGQAIMRELQGRLSGIALPTYMLDIPGGMGKVPLTPSYLDALADGGYIVEDPQGCTHHYAPQAELKS